MRLHLRQRLQSCHHIIVCFIRYEYLYYIRYIAYLAVLFKSYYFCRDSACSDICRGIVRLTEMINDDRLIFGRNDDNDIDASYSHGKLFELFLIIKNRK